MTWRSLEDVKITVICIGDFTTRKGTVRIVKMDKKKYWPKNFLTELG